ncbi:hypothetical protein ZWY2020_016534 [Hordeum vulgare]|nr:hypothetical protein ZWY2020_016534 [Hordeum vulgare]
MSMVASASLPLPSELGGSGNPPLLLSTAEAAAFGSSSTLVGGSSSPEVWHDGVLAMVVRLFLLLARRRNVAFGWAMDDGLKDHAKASTVIRKGYIRTPTPPEKIRVEPSIAIIKDLLSDDVEGHDIHFYEDAARIAKPHARDKHRPVVGTPVVSVKIGDHCYHGLGDVGASVSSIPQSYDEIKDDIAPVEMEHIDVTIQLANRDTICPVGIVRDVQVLCGKTKYSADFVVLATTQDSFSPIIFGRPFLNTVNAHIDSEKQTVTVGFEGVSHEFNFSKFGRQL